MKLSYLLCRMEEIIPGKAQIFNIEVNTIDGFLNREKDIILASCIRNKHLVTPAGFQRFYATLTRAKHCLIIYGRFAKVSKVRVRSSVYCDIILFLDILQN